MASVYWELIRIRFLTLLAYRVNYYSGIVIYTLNIGVYYFLWRAVYGSQTSLEHFSVSQMATYISVSWMARAFYFNHLDREIAGEIRDGSIAIQFLRPYRYLWVKAAQGGGEGLFRLLLFSVPGMILISFLFPVQLPLDISRWLWFSVSLVFAFCINTQINILTGMISFFLLNNTGIIRAKRVLVDLFSGLMIPLTFFPSPIYKLLSWLPFQGITYIPSSIIAKGLPIDQLIKSLIIQFVWIGILSIPIWIIWVWARRRLIIQGG